MQKCVGVCELYSLLSSIQDFDISFTTNEDPNDESFVIESADDSVHLSTPLPPLTCSCTIQAVRVPQTEALLYGVDPAR